MSHDGFKANSSIAMNADDRRRLPSEKEIMAEWASNVCQVSVLCVVYNHEKYISDAIESFLMQKTDFAFEIVIHDDASTDGSATVIAYYQSLYPNIIKPIFQSENQYSKAPNSVFVIGAESCSSDYVALCEGDDYWISENKLKIQYGYLKSHRDFDFSFHSYQANNNHYVHKSFLNKKARIISPSKMVASGPAFVALGSVMVKKSRLISICREVINFPIGDYLLQVMASHPSGAIYVSGLRSFYRTNSVNSWTENATSRNLESKIEHWRIMSNGLRFLDDHTGNSYARSFSLYNIVRLVKVLNLVGYGNDNFSEIVEHHLKNEKSVIFRLSVKILFGFRWSRLSLAIASYLLRARSYYVTRWISLF